MESRAPGEQRLRSGAARCLELDSKHRHTWIFSVAPQRISVAGVFPQSLGFLGWEKPLRGRTNTAQSSSLPRVCLQSPVALVKVFIGVFSPRPGVVVSHKHQPLRDLAASAVASCLLPCRLGHCPEVAASLGQEKEVELV